MKHSRTHFSLIAALAVYAIGYSFGAFAAPFVINDTPLLVSASVQPNVMFLIDNSGSMTNVVPDVPFDPAITYLAVCPAANLVPAGTSVNVSVLAAGPTMTYPGNVNRVWGIGGGQRCFATAVSYSGRLVGDTGAGTNASPYVPGSYLDAGYTGNYLNWYFNPTNIGGVTWINQRRKPLTATTFAQERIEITKTTANSLLDSLDNVRVGLSTYNNGNGATILQAVKDISVPANRAAIKAQVGTNSPVTGLIPGGNTPLAESLQDIGRYFVQGFNSTLTLHPGQANQSTSPAYTVLDHVPAYGGGVPVAQQVSPIQNFCQKNFTVIMTDGRPQGDQNISVASRLQDYTGDCAAAAATPTPADNCLAFGEKPAPRTYESAGSDYLDDVSLALFDMDLRPDLIDPTGKPKKTNMYTYAIGFADLDAQTDPLLMDAAIKGGGTFNTASNAAQLTQAFTSVFQDIEDKNRSASSVAASTGFITTSSIVYQARFNTLDWAGQLLAFPIMADGTIGAQLWDSGVILGGANPVPAAASRKIFTYKPSSNKGILFAWPAAPATPTATELDVAQSTSLSTNPSTSVNDGKGLERLNYVRGSAADENPSGLLFRARAVSKLGDIVDSTPRYEAAPGLPYPDSFGVGAPETSYSAYQTTQINRTPVIYVGANDGMLHAFNATSSGGQEIFAYVPNGVFTNLNKLTSINYNSTHQFFVDGSPSVSDAFFAGTWHTLVAGGLNKGGKSIYALDVTNPTSFGTSNVLWEFTDAADLGFTYSQPAIVRMHNGHWVVVFGNGYNSTNGKAVLFIRDLEDGTVTKIDTGVGVSTSADGTTPNGLATVAPVDVNGDTIVDYIYAGDLQGNMWKFDVTGNTAGSWGVAYNSGATKLPLFTACVASPCTLLNRQQITTRPDVAPKSGGGQIVLFGTGKYLESVDITRISPTNTFYGIYDNNTPNASFVAPVKSSLLQQQVLQELTVSGSSFRTTSNNALTNQPGWYINLPTVAPPGTLPATGREMQVTDSVLRSGRILFATLIPASDPCGFGGTSWLMALDARTGSRLGISLFDVNGDGYFTSADFVTSGGITVPVSGRQSREGVVGTPTILGTGNGDLLIGSGSSGNLDVNKAENNSNKGRQSFHQLQ